MTRNPLVPGFHPDPSIIAVGADYYLVNSTFEYLPGIPVQHSTDLLTWTVIGHVAVRDGQLAPDVPTLGGAWAPTIRHHDGLFWIAITDALGRGTLLFTAQDPAGPWSDGTVIAGLDGIDPDLAWDAAGTCYLTYSALRLTSFGHDGIEQVRIDEHKGMMLEEPRSLWSGTGLIFPEGPHLYELDGWWYLVMAEGGTERGHSVSVARSRQPDGPFEGHPANPLLSARSTDRPVQNTGHGDLVQAPDGSWLFVLLGMRTRGATRGFSPMGRETFATPVTWADGWPAFAPVELSAPDVPVAQEFAFDGAELGPQWISVRRFPATVADLAAAPGRLLLRGEGTGMDDPHPVFVGIRQAHVAARFTAVVDASSGLGGLSLRYDEVHHYDIEVDATTVRARARLSGIDQEWTAALPAGQVGPVTLWIDSGPVDGSDMFHALSSDTIRLGFGGIDGPTTLAVLDGRYLTAETTGSFSGRVAGVYAVSGTIAVDSFTYTGSDA